MRFSTTLLSATVLAAIASSASADEAKGTVSYKGTTEALKYVALVTGPDTFDAATTIRRLVFSTTDLAAKLTACDTLSCADSLLTNGMTVESNGGPRLNYWVVLKGGKVQYSGTVEPDALTATTDGPTELAGTLKLDELGGRWRQSGGEIRRETGEGVHRRTLSPFRRLIGSMAERTGVRTQGLRVPLPQRLSPQHAQESAPQPGGLSVRVILIAVEPAARLGMHCRGLVIISAASQGGGLTDPIVALSPLWEGRVLGHPTRFTQRPRRDLIEVEYAQRVQEFFVAPADATDALEVVRNSAPRRGHNGGLDDRHLVPLGDFINLDGDGRGGRPKDTPVGRRERTCGGAPHSNLQYVRTGPGVVR